MARYRLLEVGVWDNLNMWEVLPGSPAWEDWIIWFRTPGNTPDPLLPRPMTQSEIDAENEYAQQEVIKSTLKADNLVQQLKNRTPAHVETWIENNVNNLADAKAVLKIMGKVIAYLARKVL